MKGGPERWLSLHGKPGQIKNAGSRRRRMGLGFIRVGSLTLWERTSILLTGLASGVSVFMNSTSRGSQFRSTSVPKNQIYGMSAPLSRNKIDSTT